MANEQCAMRNFFYLCSPNERNFMTPHTILLTALLYAALLFAVAWFSGRKADNRTFFVGGRRMAWWVVALGMIGAPMSGVSFVSVPGSVAHDAFGYLQMVAGFTAGQLVIAFVLVPLFYRLQLTSLYEYLALRLGEAAHRTGALLFLLSKLLLTALKLLVVCRVMQLLVGDPLGIPFGVNIALSTLIVWGFTHRGGVRSVVWTDLLQTACLVGAVLVTIGAIMSHFGYSISTLFEVMKNSPESQVFFFEHNPLSTQTFGKMFVGGLFILVAMTGLDQDMMQRNLSCPTARDSQRNILLTALAQAGVITLLLTLGLLLYRYAESVGIEASGDDLFAAIAIYGGLPLGAGILFVLGLLSSTWSTAGSALTALTTSVIHDLLPAASRGEEEMARLRVRIHSLLALLIGLLVLLFAYGSSESLIHLLYRIVSLSYGPILGLFAFGLSTRRLLRKGWGVTGVCMAAPLLAHLVQQLALRYGGYAIGYELILYNALLTYVGLLLISKRHEN